MSKINQIGGRAMTDNTQELDEILKEVREASWSMGLQNAPLDQLHNPRNNKRATDKAKQAIIDWHNKQIEEVLDRLEAQWGETIDNTLGKPIRIKFVSVDAIQAERNRLNQSKSTHFNKLKEKRDE